MVSGDAFSYNSCKYTGEIKSSSSMKVINIPLALLLCWSIKTAIPSPEVMIIGFTVSSVYVDNRNESPSSNVRVVLCLVQYTLLEAYPSFPFIRKNVNTSRSQLPKKSVLKY